MNRKMISLAVVITAVMMVSGFNISRSMNNSTPVSDMTLENVEALAQNEDPGQVILKCYCALMSDASCAVNNNRSSVCASGVNVKCREYNNNCN
jgi:hypothetical protein